MAELCATSNAPALTVTATAVAVARGARLALNSSGTVAAAASTVRGDYVASQAAAASGTLGAFQVGAGGIVTMLNSSGGALAIGDTVYTAAAGEVTGASTSTVIMGKANTAAAASTLVEVIVSNPL